MNLDFAKAFGQNKVNKYGDEFKALAIEFVKELTDDYGEAVTAKAIISNKAVDKSGNLKSISIDLSAVVNLDDLPATVSLEDVEFISSHIRIDITNLGAKLKFNVKLNPFYSSIKDDQRGLKEWFDLIAKKDPDTLSELEDIISYIVVNANKIATNK